PRLLNARGPDGSTPFMYAVLYGDAAMLAQLLKRGADANARHDVNATPLMWAAMDLEKTRILLAHGADVNARSDSLRTPLIIAAGRPAGCLSDRQASARSRREPESDEESCFRIITPDSGCSR